MLKRGDFEVAMDFQCGFIVEPDWNLVRFVTTSDATTARQDKVIDELYQKQARAIDVGDRKNPGPRAGEAAPERGGAPLWTLQWTGSSRTARR